MNVGIAGLGPAAPDLLFEYVGSLEPPTSAAEIRSTGVGPTGEPVALWRVRDVFAATIGMTSPAVVEMPGIDPRYPMVQLFSDQRVLVSDSRATSHVPDAWIYGTNGAQLISGTLGDAIEHMVTTSDGLICIGYFDESACSSCGIE